VNKGKSLREVYAMARKRMDPTYAQYPIYEHCMPFDVSRAFMKPRGSAPADMDRRRDREMWKSIALKNKGQTLRAALSASRRKEEEEDPTGAATQQLYRFLSLV